MMRVLVMTHAGGSPYHGPNTRWYHLGRALAPLGVSVDIVSSSRFHKYFSPPAVERAYTVEHIDGLDYHWVHTPAYSARGMAQVLNQLAYTAGCFRFSRRLAALAPHVVIASSPHPFVAYPAAHIARRAGARFLFETRDLWPQVLRELGGFSSAHPYMLALSWAEAYAVRHADRILSVKAGDYRYFEERYALPPERFAYVPNGFLPDSDAAAAHGAPAPLQALRDRYRFLIVYVGAISAYYQLERLAELAGDLEDGDAVGVAVIGAGDRATSLRERAKHLSNFHMIGAIPRGEVPAALALADACYVGLADLDINKYGISCNKIYEYMHAGKPILGSYVAGDDPVAAARCGVTAAPSGNATLVSAVREWMADPATARVLGENGLRYFRANHDFSRVAERLYEEVLR